MKNRSLSQGYAGPWLIALVRRVAPWSILILFVSSASNLKAFEYLDSLDLDGYVSDFAIAAESGVAYVAVGRQEGGRLLEVDLDTLEIHDQLKLAADQQLSEVLLLHPDGSRLYLSTYQQNPPGATGFLEIRRSDFEILRELTLPTPTYGGAIAPDGEFLYLQQMINGHAGLIKVELDQFIIVGELVLNEARGFAVDMGIDPDGEFLLAAVEGNDSFVYGEGGFFRVDLDDLNVTALVSTDPLHRHFPSMAMTDDGQTVWALARENPFFDHPVEGQSSLVRINPETMVVESSVELPDGFRALRSLALDPNPLRNYAYLSERDAQGWLRVDLATLDLSGQIAHPPSALRSRRAAVVGDLGWFAGQSQISRLSLLPGVFFQDRFEVAPPSD